MFSDTRTGLVVVLGHATTLVAAFVLLLVQVAVGARLRRLLGAAGREDAAWRWPVDATLGTGVVALCLLALGAVGLLNAVAVLGCVVVLAALSGSELLRLVRETAGWFSPQARRSAAASAGVDGSATDSTVASLMRALLAVLILLLLAGAVAPPTEWDSLMYHLRIPLWLLEHGRLATPPDSFHVALVGSSHFATLPLLALGLRSGPAVMQVFALLLTVLATVRMTREVGGSRAGGWLAAAMLLGSPAFVLVAITARVDVTLVLALAAAHLALLTATSPSSATSAFAAPATGVAAPRAAARETLVAALLVAVAMGIKPQAGAYALALIPLGWRAAGGVRPAIVAALVAAVASIPWYLKNLWLVGAPLYPKGAPGWFEPWIAELYGTRVRPPEVDATILSALPEARASFDLLAAFFDPGSLTIEGEGAFYALSPLLLALPLLALAWRSRSQAAGVAAVAIAYAALVIVPFGRINMRYLMPAVPALAVAVAVALEGVSTLLGARISAGMRRALWVAAFVLAVMPLSGAIRQRFLSGHLVLLRHAAGQASAQEVWRRHPDGTARDLTPVIANVQRLVPPDGKVLMLWEARGLPLEREVLVDVMLSNWSYVAQSRGYADCLAGTGITHLLVGGGSVEYYVNRGADPRAFMLDRFANFRERCLASHASIGPGVELFTLR